MKWAWVENNLVKDVCSGNPAELYHPDIAALYSTQIPDNVGSGWTLENGEWVEPTLPVIDQPAQPNPKVSVTTFKLLFTSAERVAIYGSADVAVKDFISILDDPRTLEVDLNLQSVQEMMGYLVTLGLLTEERKNAILTGILV